jgi:hypothetical protein
MSHYNVNAGVPKTLIQYLIRWAVKTDQFDAGDRPDPAGDPRHQDLARAGAGRREGEMQSTEDRSAPTSCTISSSSTSFASGQPPSKVAFLAWQAWQDAGAGRWPPTIPSAQARLRSRRRSANGWRSSCSASSRSASSSARPCPTPRRSRPAAPQPARRLARAVGRDLVLHADDAALLAASRRRRAPSMTRWTSCRSSASRRRKLLELEQELIDRPTSSSPAARACTRRRRTATTTSIASPRRSTAPISPRRARAVRPRRPGRPAAAAARLLRRDRRAVRHRAARRGRRDAADWSFVMVGPVVKIAEDELPKRPNIHYLGRQDLRASCRPICRAGTSR